MRLLFCLSLLVASLPSISRADAVDECIANWVYPTDYWGPGEDSEYWFEACEVDLYDFACGDGVEIMSDYVCDGAQDCPNGFDEQDCPPNGFDALDYP